MQNNNETITITITKRQAAGFFKTIGMVGTRLDENFFTSLTALTTVDYF